MILTSLGAISGVFCVTMVSIGLVAACKKLIYLIVRLFLFMGELFAAVVAAIVSGTELFTRIANETHGCAQLFTHLKSLHIGALKRYSFVVSIWPYMHVSLKC